MKAFLSVAVLSLALSVPAADVKLSVKDPEPSSPLLLYSVWSRAKLTDAPTQKTAWSTNSFALIPATDSSEFMQIAQSNALTSTVGFTTGEKWIPLQPALNKELAAELVK